MALQSGKSVSAAQTNIQVVQIAASPNWIFGPPGEQQRGYCMPRRRRSILATSAKRTILHEKTTQETPVSSGQKYILTEQQMSVTRHPGRLVNSTGTTHERRMLSI